MAEPAGRVGKVLQAVARRQREPDIAAAGAARLVDDVVRRRVGERPVAGSEDADPEFRVDPCQLLGKAPRLDKNAGDVGLRPGRRRPFRGYAERRAERPRGPLPVAADTGNGIRRRPRPVQRKLQRRRSGQVPPSAPGHRVLHEPAGQCRGNVDAAAALALQGRMRRKRAAGDVHAGLRRAVERRNRRDGERRTRAWPRPSPRRTPMCRARRRLGRATRAAPPPTPPPAPRAPCRNRATRCRPRLRERRGRRARSPACAPSRCCPPPAPRTPWRAGRRP